MSVDLLQRASAKARENAGAATRGPWDAVPGPWRGPNERAIERVNSPASDRAVIPSGYALPADAEHIASWHPDVALAIADLWDALAVAWHNHGAPPPGAVAACTAARTYLGEDE